MSKLTKADILAGVRKTKTVSVKALDGEIEIRPVSDAEYAEVEATMAESIKFDTDMEDIDLEGNAPTELRGKVKPIFDVGAFARAEHKANCLAASFGLSISEDETWTPEEVGELPAGSAKEIAELVFEYSGVAPGQEEVLKYFRKEQGRPSNRNASSRGRSTRQRSGIRDTSPTDSADGGATDVPTEPRAVADA